MKTPSFLAFALACYFGMQPCDAADATKVETEITKLAVTTSDASKEKGILLVFPKAVSSAHAGRDFTFEYGVVNTLEEPVFFQTEPVELTAAVYTHPDGTRAGFPTSATWGGHSDRYALLSGSNYKTGERLSTCCSCVSSRARIKLDSSIIKPGGTLKVTVSVWGYFMKRGDQFTGEVEVSLPVVE